MPAMSSSPSGAHSPPIRPFLCQPGASSRQPLASVAGSILTSAVMK